MVPCGAPDHCSDPHRLVHTVLSLSVRAVDRLKLLSSEGQTNPAARYYGLVGVKALDGAARLTSWLWWYNPTVPVSLPSRTVLAWLEDYVTIQVWLLPLQNNLLSKLPTSLLSQWLGVVILFDGQSARDQLPMASPPNTSFPQAVRASGLWTALCYMHTKSARLSAGVAKERSKGHKTTILFINQ